jgi:cytochrome c biogenesis protein
MKLLKIQKRLKIFTDLKFALVILFFIAFASSFGSFIEQDETTFFYEENYPLTKPIYGFITSSFILNLGLDHVYRTWWFLLLLLILGISLISCTVTRQFPLFLTSKEYFFKKEKKSFLNLPFFVKVQNNYYIKEQILLKVQKMNFYIYQNQNVIYGYKGLIGRISPILVHFSLIIILIGSSIGAFKNFKAQEILPKGELFHIQNPINVGWFTEIPHLTTRVNDFWVEYEKNKIHQFYSNLSILNNYGEEIKKQTISVNNPLRYKNVDFYQSDWNLLGVRIKNIKEGKIYEFPLFSLKKNSKAWITWVNDSKKSYTLIFDQFQNNFLLYDQNGKFLGIKSIGDTIENDYILIDLLPSTGLLIKYDPSIGIIYLGFGILIITTFLSYLPYTQIWIFHQSKNSWIGGLTNRGKIQVEIEFENLIRFIENKNKKKIIKKK